LRADGGADQVADEPAGNDRRDLVEVARGGDLDDIHPDDAALLDQAVDEIPHVVIEQAAWRWPRHRRHHGRIDAVRVDRQGVFAAIGNAVENRTHSLLDHLPGSDDLRAMGPRVPDLAGAGAAGAPDADLVDALDPWHLRGAADRAAVAFAYAVHLVAPVEM